MTDPLVSFFAHSWFAKNFKLKFLNRNFGRKFSGYLLVAKKAMVVPMIASTNAAICIPFEAMTLELVLSLSGVTLFFFYDLLAFLYLERNNAGRLFYKHEPIIG